MRHTFIAIFLIAVGAFGVWVFIGNNLLPTGGFSSPTCSVQSTEVASVGNDISSTIVSGHSRLAWVRIQNLPNATNTVSLSFDEGADAVLSQGVVLSESASSTDNFIIYGQNTDFPYTGTVTGITNNGSTTVAVTECRY